MADEHRSGSGPLAPRLRGQFGDREPREHRRRKRRWRDNRRGVELGLSLPLDPGLHVTAAALRYLLLDWEDRQISCNSLPTSTAT